MELTHPYRLPAEEAMLLKVITDMKQGRIAFCLVRVRSNPTVCIEVWRKPPDDYTWQNKTLERFRERKEKALNALQQNSYRMDGRKCP